MRCRGEAEAIAHELAQLTDLGRSDPAFGQAPEAQHGGKVLGVALIVLHPPVAPVVAERMGQVDMGAEVFQDVGRPVPAVGGFEDHFGLGSGGRHGLGELEGLAQDLLDAEDLAVFGHPVDGGAATVQVDSDVLSFHRGLLLLSRVLFVEARVWFTMLGSSRGAEAPPLHRISSAAVMDRQAARSPGPPSDVGTAAFDATCRPDRVP